MNMNYVVLGTNNMPAAVQFYDALFEQTGFMQTFATDRMTYWQNDNMAFALAIPFDEKEATNGNGTMIGFGVDSEEEVMRLHQKAIALGGRCEGKPNARGPFFSAYVRDLDNNKLCFGIMTT
ncbi:VOC family protein [Marinomonas sp. 2405UD66-6]|uniref:VOC family protein n=1 Tax=Marinomonas sp. 2405UD66-6 TaxID=3391834 RepID=UPI0039C9BDF5